MRLITRISRLLIGLVFIFSSFVKAVDPLGTSYKIEDYLTFMHMDFLVQLALPIAIALITFEFLTGVFLVFNLFPRFTLWLVTILMVIFTFETLYLAIANPIKDCGCFGDAVKLTNWQTFWKNVIIDILLIFLWSGRKYYFRKPGKTHFYYAAAAIVLSLLFQIYNLICLPVIDFRPYKVGTDLKQKIFQSQQSDKYKTVLLYRNKKTGKIHKFSEDNYPWQDTVNWEYVDTKVYKISNTQNDYSDFVLIDPFGDDVTNQILDDTSQICFLIINNGQNLKDKRFTKIFDYCKTSKFDKIFILTSSPYNWVKKLEQKHNVNYPVLFIDGTTLKTIIRTKLGIVVLKNGKIIQKTSSNCLKT